MGIGIKTVIDKIKNLKLLSVLDLEGSIYVRELPETIGILVRMRYLSLRLTYIKWLPSSIDKLMHLQTLDLRIRHRGLLFIF